MCETEERDEGLKTEKDARWKREEGTPEKESVGMKDAWR